MPATRDHQATIDDITRIGRAHLATYGAAGLSLRAVARDLGVVSSAVYRYVPSRDDLLTLLVVDGYVELAEQASRAEQDVPRDDHTGRLLALALAVRSWGIAHPARWALLFGSPVPGYEAPSAETTSPGTRVAALMMTVLQDAQRAGARPAAPWPDVPAALWRDTERVRSEFGLELSDAMLTAGVMAWVTIFGAVSFEVFGQYGADTFRDPDALFDAHLDALAMLLGLAPDRSQHHR